MPDLAQRIFKELAKEEGDYLFRSKRTVSMYDFARESKLRVKVLDDSKAWQAVGKTQIKIIGTRYKIHALRHLFSGIYRYFTGNPLDLQYLLNHRNSESTEIW